MSFKSVIQKNIQSLLTDHTLNPTILWENNHKSQPLFFWLVLLCKNKSQCRIILEKLFETNLVDVSVNNLQGQNITHIAILRLFCFYDLKEFPHALFNFSTDLNYLLTYPKIRILFYQKNDLSLNGFAMLKKMFETMYPKVYYVTYMSVYNNEIKHRLFYDETFAKNLCQKYLETQEYSEVLVSKTDFFTIEKKIGFTLDRFDLYPNLFEYNRTRINIIESINNEIFLREKGLVRCEKTTDL